jgi:hypothetical protein
MIVSAEAIHETGHAVVAVRLRIKIVSVSLYDPRAEECGLVAGEVITEHPKMARAFVLRGFN